MQMQTPTAVRSLANLVQLALDLAQQY